MTSRSDCSGRSERGREIATAVQRAQTVIRLDRPDEQSLLEADPDRLERSRTPVLLDEWQRYPPVWDLVRRSVDGDPTGGRFLLAGSATPPQAKIHSGAGRIVRLRMRPLSLAERMLTTPTVSLAALLGGGRPSVSGSSAVDLPQYAEEITASGFPAIRMLPPRARTAQLDGYLARIADVEFVEQGSRVAKPATLRAWMSAYAAATATLTPYSTLLDAATPGEGHKPAKSTIIQYRDTLTRLFLLDPIPGWLPAFNPLSRLAQAPKFHLADPALAARLLGVSAAGLLDGMRAPGSGGLLIGALFESLCALSLRVYAQRSSAAVHHLRTQNGDHEVDFIVEGDNRRIVAFEAKLSPVVDDSDVKHLKWLHARRETQLRTWLF